MRQFSSFACFDWSGQAVARPRGIALGTATTDGQTALIRPDGGWSRDAALAWLIEQAETGADLLIGIDISGGLPFIDCGAYFPGWDASPADARALWALVDATSADDPHFGAQSFVSHLDASRYFRRANALGADYGERRAGRLRVTEFESARQRLANPYSSLNLVGAAQVGKASLTAMRVLHRLAGRIPVWPFDPVPVSGPMIVEVYTSIAAVQSGLPRGRVKMRDIDALTKALTSHRHIVAPYSDGSAVNEHECDALLTAAWLGAASKNPALWTPNAMTPDVARTEGWTFGVA